MVSLLPFSCHRPFRHAVRRTPPPQSLRPPPLQHQPARDALHILLTGPFVAPQGKAFDAALRPAVGIFQWYYQIVARSRRTGQRPARSAGSGPRPPGHGQRCPRAAVSPPLAPAAVGRHATCRQRKVCARAAGERRPVAPANCGRSKRCKPPGPSAQLNKREQEQGHGFSRPGRETTARNLQRI